MRVPNGTFMQMAWVVNDIEAAMRRWHENSGVGPFFYGPRTQLDIVHRGKPSVFDFNGALQSAAVSAETWRRHTRELRGRFGLMLAVIGAALSAGLVLLPV